MPRIIQTAKYWTGPRTLRLRSSPPRLSKVSIKPGEAQPPDRQCVLVIDRQPEHHRKLTFAEELKQLLEKHGIKCDPK